MDFNCIALVGIAGGKAVLVAAMQTYFGNVDNLNPFAQCSIRVTLSDTERGCVEAAFGHAGE